MSKYIINLERVLKKFENLNADVLPIVEKGMIKGMQLLENTAKINCPVDTGYLRASIQNKVETTTDSVIGTVFTLCEYGKFIEYGTIHITGRYFMTNAYLAERAKIKEYINRELNTYFNANFKK